MEHCQHKNELTDTINTWPIQTKKLTAEILHHICRHQIKNWQQTVLQQTGTSTFDCTIFVDNKLKAHSRVFCSKLKLKTDNKVFCSKQNIYMYKVTLISLNSSNDPPEAQVDWTSRHVPVSGCNVGMAANTFSVTFFTRASKFSTTTLRFLTPAFANPFFIPTTDDFVLVRAGWSGPAPL